MTLLINKWIMTIIYALFSVGILLLISFQNVKYYAAVFDLKWLATLCVVPIFLFWGSYLIGEGRQRVKVLIKILSVIAPLLALIVFEVYKPEFNVQNAIINVEQMSDYENVKLKTEYHGMGFSPKANFFVSTGYVFDANRGEELVTIIFNPVTGKLGYLEQ